MQIKFVLLSNQEFFSVFEKKHQKNKNIEDEVKNEHMTLNLWQMWHPFKECLEDIKNLNQNA